MIMAALKIKAGSKEPSKTSAGTLTQAQVEDIAKQKLPDLNTDDLEAAKRSVIGAARSMGVQVA